MRMTVIGTGYVGTVHAACMAAMGHEVLGIDVDADRIASLAAGRAPIREAGLDELLARTVKSGRLRFSTSLAEGAAFARTHFVCVGTPQRPDGEAADLRCVDAVTDELARHLRPGSLVVGKSTVPVGTAARLGRRIAAVVPDAEVAWNPEFLREGSAVQDSMRPERIVVGVTSAHAESVLRTLYTPCCVRAPSSSVPTRPRRSSSRLPPTPSWPRRSPSSTPWRRCATLPGRMSRSLRQP